MYNRSLITCFFKLLFIAGRRFLINLGNIFFFCMGSFMEFILGFIILFFMEFIIVDFVIVLICINKFNFFLIGNKEEEDYFSNFDLVFVNLFFGLE